MDRGGPVALQRRLVDRARVALVRVEATSSGSARPAARMIRSRVTLARMVAAATDRHGASALTRAIDVAARRCRRSPTCRRPRRRRARRRGPRSPAGRRASAPRPCRARRTPPALAAPTAHAAHQPATRSNSCSRSASVSIFESRTPLTRRSTGRTAAPTISGPGPRAATDLVDADDDVVAGRPQLLLGRAGRCPLLRQADGHGRERYRRPWRARSCRGSRKTTAGSPASTSPTAASRLPSSAPPRLGCHRGEQATGGLRVEAQRLERVGRRR